MLRAAESAFSLVSRGTLAKADRVQGQKTHLNKLAQYIQSVFSDHDGMKLEINMDA